MRANVLVVDFSILETLYAIGGQGNQPLLERIRDFTENSQEKLFALKAGILQRHSGAILEALQWLGKGGAALGAWKLSEICLELEDVVGSGDEDQVREMLRVISRELREVNVSLTLYGEGARTELSPGRLP